MSLKTVYTKEIVPKLQKSLNLDNPMAVPKIIKVVVNAGVGRTLKDPKLLEFITEDLRRITGQAPVKTEAKKSVSGFKIREGQVVGLTVTLRGQRMYDFLQKLVAVALPRVRDFKGLNPKSFDHKGNYSIGVKEQIVFPETSRDQVEQTFGFEINIATNAGNDEKALALLKALGFPFRDK
ncbi:MAG: 50S ribosomal protein L5 [Acidobacteriaceae bacterium]